MKVAILVRVSSKSDRQDYDRQISDLKAIEGITNIRVKTYAKPLSDFNPSFFDNIFTVQNNIIPTNGTNMFKHTQIKF